MATIGQALTTPESGWRRYNDTAGSFAFTGTGWKSESSTINWYNNNYHATLVVGDSIFFKFYGSKLRICTTIDSVQHVGGKYQIKIDDSIVDTYTVNPNNGSVTVCALVYEKTGLTMGFHTVTITVTDTLSVSDGTTFNVVDIDSTGYLVHPILNQVSSLNDMQVGDCIPCRFTAVTSGAVGVCSEFGTCKADEIPVTGSATSDGLFYFTKVDKGLLMADRNVQSNVSWNTLNSSGLIDGKPLLINLIPSMTSNTAPSGEVIYSDTQVYSDWYYPFHVFDASATSYWNSDTTAYPHYIGYDFKTPTRVSVYAITLRNVNSDDLSLGPKNWTFEGSNDGTNWVVLDTRSGITWTASGQQKTFSFNSDTAYQKYRINVTAGGSTGTQISIGQISMYENTIGLMRSMSGGVAYIDANGNASLTDKLLGAWPANNEWDKYIVNSDLDGKITKGDENIWHYSSLWSACKDTTTSGTWTPSKGTATASTNANRIVRGYTNSSAFPNISFGATGTVYQTVGFRPVLEYIEPDGSSKQTNLWY